MRTTARLDSIRPSDLPCRESPGWLRCTARAVAGLLALGAAAVLAQAPGPLTSREPTPPPEIRLQVIGMVEQPVALRGAQVRTEIVGRSAVTEIVLTFHNPNGRVLEGELQFPLADGQSVVGMAMELDGTLREAVPIEKSRGEAVFEDVTRTRIDPAIVSQTQGQNYKLRVYPLTPRSDRRVLLRVAETLTLRGGRLQYRLPLAFDDRLQQLQVAIEVAGAAAAPQLQARGLEPPAFRLSVVPGARDAASPDATSGGVRHRVSFERRDLVVHDSLEVAFALAPGAAVTTQARDGRQWFQAQVPVKTERAARALPARVLIGWDASGSGAGRDHGREFALLDAYFARARRIEVNLVRLRDAAEPPQTFSVRDGDWRALRTALEQTVYDGATDLGALAAYLPKNASGSEAGEVLLFSDGLSNYGAQRLPVPAVPLYAITAADRADGVRLRAIAEPSGGRLVDLKRLGAPEAAAELLQAGTRLVSISAPGARELLSASPHPTGGQLTVVGELTQPRTALRLELMHPNGRREVKEVVIDAARSAGRLAAQAWARMKIDALEAEHEFHRAEIRRLGLAFGIVSRETSLIILDRAEDYARHEVTPPPELAQAVAAIRERTRQAAKASEAAQLERVVRLFEDRQAWWQRDFPKEAPPPPEPPKDRAGPMPVASGAPARDDTRMMAAPAAPTAPAAPAPVRAPSMAPPAMAAPAVMAQAKSSDGGAAAATPAASIRLQPAASNAPYLRRLRESAPEAMYRIYLDERASFTHSTAFVLDVADLFFERGQTALGLRILSNLAEMDLENRQILRLLGQRLVQAQRPDLALPVLRRVLVLAPDEPQSSRDLGLALAAAGQRQAAIEALYEVGRRQWPRFPEIELIALTEMNALVATAPAPLDTSRIDPRLLKNLPLDLRVVLAWDTDNTDIDLWVIDPNGERCFYGKPLSYQGGRMSRDATGGYGPEEFSLRRAKPGKYQVKAQFYGHRQQLLAGATTVQLTLSTGFGTPRQQDRRTTLRLEEAKAEVLVGEFEVRAAE